jgi:ribonucleoside-diphosphate reductase alpha chain
MAKLGQIAIKVLKERYLLKNDAGEVTETFDDLVDRVASAVADAEKLFFDNDGPEPPETKEAQQSKRNEACANFREMLGMRDFLPNSPTLMNAGVEGGQLSACFVLPVDDDIPAIFNAVKDMAVIFKSGGGVGLPMSRLRPRGDAVRSTGGVSSGPVSFMRVYNTTAEVVAQGGKRRGALMGTLRVDHPDIIEFIEAKQDLQTLTSFNVSVAITDSFMQAVESGSSYSVFNPRNHEACGDLDAREVWNKLVQCAWRTGEPGIMFIDRMNEYHREYVTKEGVIEGTNPCGEIPLLAYESCNLGSINLRNFVDHPFTEHAEIANDRLMDMVHVAVRFLDNVIQINTYPLPQIAEATKRTRKIGLGVMGFADMLLCLGVRYGTKESQDLLHSTLRTIYRTAEAASTELATERGVYPANETITGHRRGQRNGTLTAIAPTGSISMIAEVTGGIEPMFAVAMERQNVLDGTPFLQLSETFAELLRAYDYEGAEVSIAKKVAEGGVLAEIIPNVPKQFRDAVVCAHQVPPEEHVEMQSRAQQWSDNAVSKTVNLPNSATPEDVDSIFWQAYRSECKGITVYRDGCREHQPMTRITSEPDGSETGESDGATPSIDQVRQWMKDVGIREHQDAGHLKPKKRPVSLPGHTVKMKTGCGTLFVTISQGERGQPVELFAHHGKAGICSAAQCEAIGRLSSMSLRAGVDPEEVADQLRGITCHETHGIGPTKVYSCADGIAKAILHAIGKEPEKGESSRPSFMGACPKCGSGTIREAGCVVCKACGWEKC